MRLLKSGGVRHSIKPNEDVQEPKNETRADSADASEARHPLELLERALRDTQDAVLITEYHPIDPPGPRIVYANDGFRRMTGYEPESVLGRNPHFLQGEKTDRTALKRIKGRLRAGESVTQELLNYRKDGSEFWVELNIVPLKAGRRGEPTHWMSIQRDVTERRNAEERIQIQAAALRAAHNAIVITDTNGIIQWVNPAFTTMTGYTLEESVGKSTGLLSSGKHDRSFYKDLWDTISAGNVWQGEVINRRKNGELYYEEQAVTPVLNEHGGIERYVAIKQDVTERKKAELERERLASAVAHTVEPIVITDTKGIIVYVNPAFERTTGFSYEEARGQKPSILRSGHHSEAFYRELWETITRGHIWRGRFTNMAKDGTMFEVESTISPILNPESKEIIYFVAVSRDVSREKQLREEIRQVQKLEAVGRLAGGIAHDFNNVLTSILGYAQIVLAEMEHNDPRRKDVMEIMHAGERASELTKQLLTFGRKQSVQLRPLDLNRNLADMDQLLRRTLGEHIEVISLRGDNLGTVNADAGAVEQVLLNLAVNARDAMPRGGSLAIETKAVTLPDPINDGEESDFVMLRVKDTGIGMTKEVRNKVFEPFFTTKPKGEGSGLGLSTVFGIVEQCGGFIELDSRPGAGSEFRIFFPRQTDEGEVILEAADINMPRGEETILIVEDEDGVRKLTGRMLRNLGYTILEARDGMDALEILRSSKVPIQLILTDVVMPRMSGTALIEKANMLRGDFKVLYVSGFTGDHEPKGVDGIRTKYLQKPYSRTTLAVTVRELLDT
ncbi:MAG: PAS domain S-box protein [Verrucomicrobia bacterium]|nr:PAS domain S-box protein [Verrucomicrobiota bacterium]